MEYVITDGNNYIKKGNGRPSTTAKLNEARTFTDKVRAQNFCVCLPGTMKKFGFYVVEKIPSGMKIYQPVEDQTYVQIPMTHTEMFEPAEQLDEKALDIEYIHKTINDFEDMVCLLKNQEELIRQQQIYAEACIFDIEHAAEFSKLNARQGFNVYKMLHEARVLRRKCKDVLDIISLIDEEVTDNVADHRMTRRLAGMDNRQFSPRAIPDLFDCIKG